MKRFVQVALTCLMTLAVVSTAVAQQPATPVVRIGDWVEVGNEVFMNIIASSDIRYRTTKNYDFESRIDDRVISRDNLSTNVHNGEGDLMYAETRLGVDMRYQKSLQLQVLFEQQSVFDGNLIDNVRGTSPGCPAAPAGGFPAGDGCRNVAAPAQENNYVNLERFWIDYKFPGTPFRMRVGADLWSTDAAGIVADDDPRFAVFYDGDPFQAYAAAVIQNESSRLGLTNDNDLIYYTFGASYNFKPHRIALDVAWFRDRFSGAVGQADFGQKHDTVMISPSWKGSFGPINALVQGSFQLGTADGTAATGSQEFDVWNWAAVGYLEAKLGMVTPFLAVIYGTGDDDPRDDQLGGFAMPFRDISIVASGFFDTFDTSTSFGERATAAPARAAFAGSPAGQFRHSVGNPFSDLIGNNTHRNAAGAVLINSTLSNPGVLMPMAGIKVAPLKGHNVDLWWIWTRLDQLETLQQAAFNAMPATLSPADQRRYRAAVADIDPNMTHEIALAYTWTLNPNFDIRLTGNVIIPLDGAKAIARTQDCEPSVPGLQSCQGEDIALRGEARFRARF